jgi:hypothetical protein
MMVVLTQWRFKFFYILNIEFRKSYTIKEDSRTVGQVCNQMLIFHK